MLFRHINLEKAADILEYAIEETVGNKIVTYDLARQMDNVRPVRCSEYGEVIKKRIEQRA
jgi:isocitrate dehydrogenase